MNAVIEIENLSKRYRVPGLRKRFRPALDNLTLRVEAGEVFGYLGPNGSGKTTTLKLLMGLVRPDSGSARILGEPLASGCWRSRVGYLPEHPYLYDYLSVREYLDYVGRLFAMPRAARHAASKRLLELVGLSAWGDVPMRRFSKGMMQRAGVAQALMNDPELVFLDEPMSGLDPLGRRFVRDLIVDLKARGKTVFFSTHILSDAESLCDRVAVLAGGKLLKAGRIDEILNVNVSHFEVLVTGLSVEAARALPGSPVVQAVGERWRIETPEAHLDAVLAALRAAGCRLLGVNPVRQSLEEYFVKEMKAQEGSEATWLVD